MRWSSDQIKALKTYFYHDYTDEEIADALGFDDVRVVIRKRLSLGMKRSELRGGHPIWAEVELELVRTRPDLRAEDLAKITGRSRMAVEAKRAELGIKSRYYTRWRPEELEVLMREYPPKGSRHVARLIGKTPRQVQTKASAYGLKREWAA